MVYVTSVYLRSTCYVKQIHGEVVLKRVTYNPIEGSGGKTRKVRFQCNCFENTIQGTDIVAPPFQPI